MKNPLGVIVGICLLTTSCAMTPMFGRLSDSQKAASYNAELAANYLVTGDLEQAQIKLDRAMEQDSRNALANNTYAKLSARLDKHSQAERYFRRAIQYDANRAEYVNDYAIYMCERNRIAEALVTFQQAADNKFYRTPEFALDNAGVCAMDGGLNDKADQYLRAALKRNPVFAPALLHMAELTLKKGDVKLADAYYARFLTLARQTPQSLIVGIDIRRELGDEAAVDEFGKQLLSTYPRSDQAKIYLASQ